MFPAARRILAVACLLGLACRAEAPTSTLAQLGGPPHWGPWSAPRNLGPVVNSVSSDQQPAISKDGLSLYFASNRAGGLGALDLWVTRRVNLDAPWGAPVNLGAPANSSADDNAPNFTPDQHHLYFHSGRAGGCGGLDLYVARRQDRQDDLGWETPVNLGCVVNSPFDDAGPALFEDSERGLTTLLLNSNRPGGPGDLDIYQATRAGDDDPFGPAVLVPELSGPFRDTRIAVFRSGLELFLSSESNGRPGGLGSQDLWVSTRASTLDPWSAPANLGSAINTTAFDGAPALSWDGTTLYFFSARPGGSGGNDLYVTTRSRLHGP